MEECQEKHDKIDEWERREQKRLQDEMASGKMRLNYWSLRYEVESNAENMRRSLDTNCQTRADKEEANTRKKGVAEGTREAKREARQPTVQPVYSIDSMTRGCLSNDGSKEVMVVKDANGDLHPAIGIKVTLLAEAIVVNFCAVPAVAVFDGPEGFDVAGYVYHDGTGERIPVSKNSSTLRGERYHHLNGWASP